MPALIDDTSSTSQSFEPVHRLVFPSEAQSGVWPLYAEAGSAIASDVYDYPRDARPPFLRLGRSRLNKRPNLRDYTRHAGTLEPNQHISFATYFNAFPAAYWQQWTNVRTVRLMVSAEGRGLIELYRSNAIGSYIRLEHALVEGTQTWAFDVDLNRFADGGWLWFNARSFDGGPLRIVEAAWCAPVSARTATHTTHATVAMTTFNMGPECVKQMNAFADHPEVLDRLAAVQIADQGSKRVADTPGYEEAAARLGDKLRVIVQPNLGGSGGFSRGMYESVKDPNSDYVLLLDDDASAEPESVLRAIQFADYTKSPTIVGGHMFNLHEPTVLHSFGETINMREMWWHSCDPELSGVDFAGRSIRTNPELNYRVDVAYNGWWMCLIPNAVIEKIGLSLPVFIKWDDSEYGLRAHENGFSTVSLPGMAAWHVPWTEKDDGLDWQAYFHMRNRWIVALLHSPFAAGGSLLWASIKGDIGNLLSMRYSVMDLRIMALRDLLRGPGGLHRVASSRAADARAKMAGQPDTTLITDSAEYPDVVPTRNTRLGLDSASRLPLRRRLRLVARGALYQLMPTKKGRVEPEVWLRHKMTRWWKLANVDSALVTNAGGEGVWWYRRDRSRALAQVRQIAKLYVKLARRWPQLSQTYRDALPQITSMEEWERTFNGR